MSRLSGVTPSGHIHLGNHLGAVSRWAADRAPDDLFFISDMHAMTVSYRPSTLRTLTRESFAVLVAAGIDPDSVFVQSDLAGELGALNWVLECTCSYGEAARMIQFKEKAGDQQSVRLGLLTYPALMAADILLQGATEVPVGSDQDQHVELARTLARRFNSEHGEVFAVPSATVAPTTARILDLSDPTRKMAKSAGSSTGVVHVLDEPDLVRRKMRRAVTDDLGTVRYAPDDQPGVSNLLAILGACQGATPFSLASQFSSYGALKEAAAEAVIEHLQPVRERTKELLADPDELNRIRARGAKRAADRAQPRLSAALRLAGLR